jgi:hypothetical protein
VRRGTLTRFVVPLEPAPTWLPLDPAKLPTIAEKSATLGALTAGPVQYRCTRSSKSVRVSGTMWIGVPTQEASRMYGRPPKVPR